MTWLKRVLDDIAAFFGYIAAFLAYLVIPILVGVGFILLRRGFVGMVVLAPIAAVVFLVMLIGWSVLLDVVGIVGLPSGPGLTPTTPPPPVKTWQVVLLFGPPIVATFLAIRWVFAGLPKWLRGKEHLGPE